KRIVGLIISREKALERRPSLHHTWRTTMRTTLARHTAALIACAGLSLAAPAFAQDKTVKIGVLNDMSSLYSDIGGPNMVRQWIDVDKVDAVVDTPNSGVALAVSNLVKEKNSILINSAAPALTSPV